MRLAWFTPDLTGDLARLVRALAPAHQIAVFDARRAHDFVWQHAREPHDLCVYELDNTPAHQFVWAYLVNYPGVTLLRRTSLRASRSGPIADSRQHWHLLRLALLASRIVVVPHAATAELLGDEFPDARVRHVTPGVVPIACPSDRPILALDWPVDGHPLIGALEGFAAGCAVVVFDTPEAADWPSLDPHDWQPRTAAPPMCVAIDPRDEQHSTRVAIERLTRDAPLRTRLGQAARTWWETHATVDRATAAFERVLAEAAMLAPPPRPRDWPAGLQDTGEERARAILAPFGVDDLGFTTAP